MKSAKSATAQQVDPAQVPDPTPDTEVVMHDVTPEHVVEHRVARWRSELAELAGASPLMDLRVLGEQLVDLSAAHPAGTAQLFASDATKLSALFRESTKLSQARAKMREITRQGQEIAAGHGVAATCLVLGIGQWEDETHHELPLLLRPAHLKHVGGALNDTAIELAPTAFLNPVFLRLLRERSAILDAEDLVRECFTVSGFAPWQVLERVAATAASVLPGFSLDKRTVLGSFVQPGQMLVDDLNSLGQRVHSHPVVRAMAGLEGQVAMPTDGAEIPYEPDPDHEPHSEPGIGDLDARERFAVDIALQGHHLFVDAPTGTDPSKVAAALAAQYAREGRTVALVSGQRRTARDVITHLEQHDLADAVLDVPSGPGWVETVGKRLLSALTLEPRAFDHAQAHATRQELMARADQLNGYITALHRKRAPWNVSAYECLEELAELGSRRPAPLTSVRFSAEVTQRLSEGERVALAADLQELAELGGFSHRAVSQSWFGAEVSSPGQASDALTRVNRLLDNSLPKLSQQITSITQIVGLTRPQTPAQWQDELTMLAGMRQTLDVFLPLAYERPVKDLIAATAPRQERVEDGSKISQVGALTRRRLRQQAMDLVRPGSHVPDLHAALIKIEQQRELWQQYAPAGGWPRLPEGLSEAEATAAQVFADLQALGNYLSTTSSGGDLMHTDLATVHDRLVKLRLDASALEELPRRTIIQRNAERLGVSELLNDLMQRRVDGKLVAAELDLAWWGSVLEQILQSEPALGTYSGQALDALSRRFSELDREHLRLQGCQARHDLAQNLAHLLTVHSAEAESIFAQLIEGAMLDIPQAMSRHREVLPRLRPILVAPAAQMSQVIPVDLQLDLVILTGVEELTSANVVGAITRGKQLVVLGDLTQPTGVLSELAGVLPVVRLGDGYAERDPALTEFLTKHGTDGATPGWPRPVVRTTVSLELVDGSGMPDSHTGMVATTAAEVERVIELAINHALLCPQESLAIIAGTAEHAERIREALDAEVAKSPALQPFFEAEGARAVAVCDLTQAKGLRRQAVIFSLGFGRTPHGRVLHRFGTLSTDAGLEHLVGAVGVTRCRLTVVSTFGADDLDPGRLRTPGAQALQELLALAADPGAIGAVSLGYEDDSPVAVQEPATTHARLLLDLADRLWHEGLNVELDYGVKGGRRIPMAVGHPQLPDRLLVAVLTDDDAYTAEPSIRLRDRHFADELRDLGWHVLQVWSAALFLDPAGEAQRILQEVLAAAQEQLAFKMPPPPPSGGFGDLEVLDDVQPPLSVGEPLVSAPQLALESTLSAIPEQGPDLAPSSAPNVGLRPGFRPNVVPGLPISAYGDNDLDDLLAWLRSRGIGDEPGVLARHMRDELGISRRSTRVDLAVQGALRRAGLWSSGD